MYQIAEDMLDAGSKKNIRISFYYFRHQNVYIMLMKTQQFTFGVCVCCYENSNWNNIWKQNLRSQACFQKYCMLLVGDVQS